MLRFFKNQAIYGVGVWLEIILFPAVGVILAVWLDRTTPFDAGQFPWLWLIPLLIGLRYGLVAGATSSLLLVVDSYTAFWLNYTAQPMSTLQIVGGLFLTLVAGQYSSIWHGRMERFQARLDYTEDRLETLGRTHFITRISHDRLEEALITQPVTLRQAMEALGQLNVEVSGGLSMSGANALLQLLAQYCRFDSSSLFLYDGVKFIRQPISHIGRSTVLEISDPLIVAVLERKNAAFYSVADLRTLRNDLKESRYRVVFPLISATKEWIGILTVDDMPLLAHTEENLTVAAAILQYVADDAWSRRATSLLRHNFPACPTMFARELIRLQHLRMSNGLRSTLIGFRCGDASRGREIGERLIALLRTLDLHWYHPPFADHQHGLVILLPLAGPASVHGFIKRITLTLEEEGLMGLNGRDADCGITQIYMDHRSPSELLRAVGVEEIPQK